MKKKLNLKHIIIILFINLLNISDEAYSQNVDELFKKIDLFRFLNIE